MSNHLAIATVTEALRHLVLNGISMIDSGIDVTTDRPSDSADDDAAHVNVYLYQVTPSPSHRNNDLPTRRADGSIVERPTVALDLHYLISFYGSDAGGDLEAQILLGATVSALHTQPILSRDIIIAALDETASTLLGDSNLVDQIEHVRITPESLDLEELSKLWSVFFQTPYTISVAYQCSVVLIEAAVTAQRSLPVRAAGIRAVPISRTSITDIVDRDDERAPITVDSTILIRGTGLAGESVAVVVGDLEITPKRIAPTEIELDLSDPDPHAVDNLRAGIIPVQTIHRIPMDPADVPASLRFGWSSNPAPLILRPRILSTTIDAPNNEIDVEVTPPVGPRQRATLLLNELNPPPNQAPRSYVIDVPPRTGPAATDTITFPIAGVEAADYLVRIQIDGAESTLGTDANGDYDSPTETIA